MDIEFAVSKRLFYLSGMSYYLILWLLSYFYQFFNFAFLFQGDPCK